MKCTVCGSSRVIPDPAGYYNHAIRADGAPMMCLNWNHSSVADTARHSSYAADLYSAKRAELKDRESDGLPRLSS